MDHVLASFHSQAHPTLCTFLFSNTKNRRFRRKVTKAPALAKASMPTGVMAPHMEVTPNMRETPHYIDSTQLLPKRE